MALDNETVQSTSSDMPISSKMTATPSPTNTPSGTEMALASNTKSKIIDYIARDHIINSNSYFI